MKYGAENQFQIQGNFFFRAAESVGQKASASVK